MTHSADNPLEHPEVQLADGRGYLLVYLFSSALLGAATWLVAKQAMAPLGLFLLTTALAGVVVVAQGVFLLHMEFSETQRWHTVSLVLFIPLFILTIGLSSWMFHGLYRRTMLTPRTAAPAAAASAGAPAMPGMDR